MLGVQPFLGRLFTPEEDRPGGNTVAVLSYGCWKEKFGGDPAAIGKTIRRTANDAEFTIIGVLPADFKFATENFALWAPINTDPNYRSRDDHNLLVFARLKEGVTLPQASTDGWRGATARRRVSDDQRRLGYYRAAITALLLQRTKHPADALGSARGCGVPASDCLRECCQPVVGTRDRAAQGDCVTASRGSHSIAFGPAIADRESPAGSDRQRDKFYWLGWPSSL